MQDSSFDYARLAAEAFIAANRCEDPRQAALLREEAYRLVGLIDGKREESARALSDDFPVITWEEVLSGPQIPNRLVNG